MGVGEIVDGPVRLYLLKRGQPFEHDPPYGEIHARFGQRYMTWLGGLAGGASEPDRFIAAKKSP